MRGNDISWQVSEGPEVTILERRWKVQNAYKRGERKRTKNAAYRHGDSHVLKLSVQQTYNYCKYLKILCAIVRKINVYCLFFRFLLRLARSSAIVATLRLFDFVFPLAKGQTWSHSLCRLHKHPVAWHIYLRHVISQNALIHKRSSALLNHFYTH